MIQRIQTVFLFFAAIFAGLMFLCPIAAVDYGTEQMLLTILGVEHLHYQLIKADIKVDEKVIETYVCVSEDFKDKNEDKMPLDNYYDVEHAEGEDRLTFCINRGFEDYIYQMLEEQFELKSKQRGIAFTIPVSAVGGNVTLQILLGKTRNLI